MDIKNGMFISGDLSGRVLSQEDWDYYDHMNRAQLIRHCVAMSEAIHELSNRLMFFINKRY